MPTSHFDPFFDLSQDLLGVLDSHGQFLRVGASFQRDLGWSHTALNGRTFLSLIHQADVDATTAHLRDLASDGSPRVFNALVLNAGGAYSRVRWHVNRPALDGTQVFIAGRLVEDSRRSSGPAHLAAQVLSELATHISDFLWVRDAKTGTILYVNDVWERMTGQKVRVGEHFSEFFKSTHPSDIEMAKDAGRRSESQGGYDEIVRAIDTEGATRWLRVRTFPVRDANGETYRVVGIAEDVTELQRAQEALRNSTQRFRSLIEHSSDLILLLDAVGRFTYLSPSFEVTLGFPVQDWINQSGFDLVWPDDLEAARVLLGRITQTPATPTLWQMRLRHVGRHVPVAGGHERQSPRRSGHRRGRGQLP